MRRALLLLLLPTLAAACGPATEGERGDVFAGTQHLDITQSSGAQCGVLVGTANNQLDQLPCSIDLDGSGTKS